ncbi:MAG TPA: ATP-binding protein [Polyangiaceae bacterium]|nr:ATP-binding protein [Polyangiaceae bacterium]
MTETPSSVVEEVLSGGGEMGARMRDMDWSQTPLGPVVAWPPSLRSALSICLGSAFPIAIYWGPKLALLYNDAWSPILGSKHPWALGRPAVEVWPEIWDAIAPLFEKVMTHGEATYSEDSLLLMRRHGYTEECYFNFTFTPIKGAKARIEGVFNAVIETTFRVISERRTRALRELLDQTTRARSPEEACELAAKTLGAATEDVPFCGLYLIDEAGEHAHLAGFSGLEPGTPALPRRVSLAEGAESPWPIRRARESGHLELVTSLDESLGPLPGGAWPEPATSALVAPILSGSSVRAVGALVLGINPRRAVDEEYRQFTERAASHVANAVSTTTAYALERRRAETLAELDRAKTAFFSNVSHEFRTPLTLMLGPTEDALASPTRALTGEDLQAVHRNGKRLLKLVNTLLDYSRIEAGRAKASFAPTDLAALTVDLASSFRSLLDKAGLALIVDCPPLPEPVWVDREMWEKIVLNLLSNAFKFTFQGEIAVSLRWVGSHAELSVRDTGTGIPREALPRLFERFQRVEGAKGRTFEGSGIGLALVQELVKLHGGQIRVESQEGKGTTFSVSLPAGHAHLDAASVHETEQPQRSSGGGVYVDEALLWLPSEQSAAAEQPSRTVAAASAEGSVLVADDNSDMRDYIVRLLRQEGVQVTAVANGRAALDAARKDRPDLVLTDVMMPELDGFGLLAALRQDAALRTVPILMLSARAGEEARVEGLDAGADDYLVKPFAAKELLSRVRRLLENDRLRRATEESEQRFRNMADHAPIMLWVTDPQGVCTYLSKGWYEFTGQTEETGLGMGWLSAVHPEDARRSADVFLAANADAAPFSLDYRLRRKDGQYRWAIDSASPRFGPDGEYLGYVGSVVDITERKAAEEVMSQLNRTLEQRVLERTAELQQANQELESFSYSVSHDLRAPLRHILGFAQLLDKNLSKDALDPKTKGFLTTITEAAQRGGQLVDDLLAFSRLGRAELAKKRVNLVQLVNDTRRDLAPETAGRDVDWQIHPLPDVNGDPALLRLVLKNLLSNALKYSRPKPKATIEIGAAEAPGEVEIWVKDNGVGFEMKYVDKLFGVFQRLHTSEQFEGTGIGLAHVRRIITRHGGRTWAEGEVNRGATIHFTLPA